jgi:hypothetical protein
VLLLVGDQHLVGEAVAEDRVGGILEIDPFEHLERPLADLVPVGAELGAAEDRQLVAPGPRVLDRVVEPAEVAVQRLAATGGLDQPELLEVGDVPEVPGERAEQRRVDRVELLVVELFDQQQRPLPCFRQPLGDLRPIGCLRRRRDESSLAGRRGGR